LYKKILIAALLQRLLYYYYYYIIIIMSCTQFAKNDYIVIKTHFAC